jgi:hypothetical protein
MNTLAKLIIGFLIAGVSLFVVLWKMEGCKNTKLTQEVYDCRHAPVHIDTVIKTVKVTDSIWLQPKEVVRWKTEFIHDTVPAKWCDKFYSDTYKYIKGTLVGKIGYEIRSKDCGIDIRFPEITLPVQYITETKVVDTCLHPIVKSKWEWELNAYPIAYDLINFHWKALAEANVSYWRIKIGVEPEMTIEKTPRFGITAKLGYKFLN